MSNNESRMDQDAASRWELLPEFDPDPALWSRIQSRRAHQQVRRRQRQRWVASGLAVAALLCVVAVSRFQIEQPKPDQVAVWQGYSQALEQEWLAMARATPDPRVRAELRLIDLELQTAYDRGAAESELIPLWKLRNEALRELIDNDVSRMRAVTRL
ncbi:hypothetical protein [Dokdonella sp.]|uniref:hypothetical protein n=1 Tax=Dokdonella sp. TaxID=2291710 RepID=UPI003528BA11